MPAIPLDHDEEELPNSPRQSRPDNNRPSPRTRWKALAGRSTGRRRPPKPRRRSPRTRAGGSDDDITALRSYADREASDVESRVSQSSSVRVAADEANLHREMVERDLNAIQVNATDLDRFIVGQRMQHQSSGDLNAAYDESREASRDHWLSWLFPRLRKVRPLQGNGQPSLARHCGSACMARLHMGLIA